MGTSKSAMSAVLRVTSVMRWILAVAARRPSITDSGRLALSRPRNRVIDRQNVFAKGLIDGYKPVLNRVGLKQDPPRTR